jgi:hypothetical protein
MWPTSAFFLALMHRLATTAGAMTLPPSLPPVGPCYHTILCKLSAFFIRRHHHPQHTGINKLSMLGAAAHDHKVAAARAQAVVVA